jgi:hypothetical protein
MKSADATEKIIRQLKQHIVNARVDLEQGGKLNWNSDLDHCDGNLSMALMLLNQLQINK